MPIRSSDTSSEASEGTGERPVRRRTSAGTGSTRIRSTSRTRRSPDAETPPEQAPLPPVPSDEFGDGVDESRARPAAAEPAPAAPRQLAFFSTDEIDFGDRDSDDQDAGYADDGPFPETAESGEQAPVTDESGRPVRRRRRRRRRGPTTDGRPVSAEPRIVPEDTRRASTEARVPQSGERGPSYPSRGGSSDAGGRQEHQRSRGGRRRGRATGQSDERSRRGREGVPRDRELGGVPRRARQVQPAGEVIEGTFEGVLELHPKGYGFLREPRKNYAAEDSNPFVSSTLVEKHKLREGVLIRGNVGQGTRNQGPRLQDIELIDGFTPDEYLKVRHFDNLTPINPFEQIRLETGPRPLTMRVMDLLCPIGKGQRALLVAPPRTGKTMLLQDIAHAVTVNHPEIHLMVLLIDERPEEVTEIRRLAHGEVIASSLDHDVESHVRISQLIIERGKRLAEEGKDVFILLDSITRMARAFNKWSNSGRTATGGLDIRALDIPKKLFGTARRFDEGGSLTVCGTALIDTGSRMDEAIFQEFKGTGNMEMVLSRELADRRIWPSIDVTKSGTRREEKILAPDVLEGTTLLRRSLISMNPVEAMEQLTKTMEKFPSNREFLQKIRAVL